MKREGLLLQSSNCMTFKVMEGQEVGLVNMHMARERQPVMSCMVGLEEWQSIASERGRVAMK